MPSDQQIKTARETLIQAGHIRRGCRPNTVLPYYKEKYALEFKKEVDKILANPDEPVVIAPRNCRLVTQYHKLIQGRLYLIDHLDPEGTYREAKKHLEMKQLKEKGIITMSFQGKSIKE